MPTSLPSMDASLEQAPSLRAKRFFSRVPLYAYLGLALNVLAWASSWLRIGPWAYTFFPLWLGFILLLDGLVVARKGSSLLTRDWRRFVLLFLLSSPFWWLFEALNAPVQNWHYILDHHYTPAAYTAITSLDFSTVLPAVFEMAKLLGSFKPLRPRLPDSDIGPRLPGAAVIALVALGITMVLLAIFFPRYAYPFVWLCLIFLLDPINNYLRRKSAFAHLLAGDIRFLVVLPVATLCCGFFWEMWNFYALPKWYYTVPFFDSWPHLFEMPLPGYLGYLPFGIELFAMYQLALFILRIRNDNLAF